jgi:hypothetical protein
MNGITEIFALVSITLLLNVIDIRQYTKLSAHHSLPLREDEEIKLAQCDALMLIKFLTERIHLVEDSTGKSVSVENVFLSYLGVQGRWLLWELRNTSSHSAVQQKEVHHRLSAAEFLQDNNARLMLKGEVLKEWADGVSNCFTPLNQVVPVGFPNITQENIKRKTLPNITK